VAAIENPLFYAHADHGEHLDGGACIAVFADETPVDRMWRYSEEYTVALAALLVASEGKPTGWQYAAPAVYLAHHACELALKVRWLMADPSVDESQRRFHDHDLKSLMAKLDGCRGWEGAREARDAAALQIERLREVTVDGQQVRYALIDPKWCCLNLKELVELVEVIRRAAMNEPVAVV